MPDQVIPPLDSMIRTETITDVHRLGGGRYEIVTRPDAHGSWVFAFTPGDGVAPQAGEVATFHGQFVTVDVVEINGRVYRIAGR